MIPGGHPIACVPVGTGLDETLAERVPVPDPTSGLPGRIIPNGPGFLALAVAPVAGTVDRRTSVTASLIAAWSIQTAASIRTLHDIGDFARSSLTATHAVDLASGITLSWSASARSSQTIPYALLTGSALKVHYDIGDFARSFLTTGNAIFQRVASSLTMGLGMPVAASLQTGYATRVGGSLTCRYGTRVAHQVAQPTAIQLSQGLATVHSCLSATRTAVRINWSIRLSLARHHPYQTAMGSCLALPSGYDTRSNLAMAFGINTRVASILAVPYSPLIRHGSSLAMPNAMLTGNPVQSGLAMPNAMTAEEVYLMADEVIILHEGIAYR